MGTLLSSLVQSSSYSFTRSSYSLPTYRQFTQYRLMVTSEKAKNIMSRMQRYDSEAINRTLYDCIERICPWISQTESVAPHNHGIDQYPQELSDCLLPPPGRWASPKSQDSVSFTEASFLPQPNTTAPLSMKTAWVRLCGPPTLYFWAPRQQKLQHFWSLLVCRFKWPEPTMHPYSSCLPSPVMSTSGF